MFICINPAVSGIHCFFEVIYHLWHFQSFSLLFLIDIWDLREKVSMKLSHLGLSVQSLTLCTLVSCAFLLAAIYCRKKLLWWWLCEARICRYRRISLQETLFLCSSSRTIIFDFPLGPWPSQSQVLGLLCSVRHEFHHTEQSFHPIR